MMVMQGGGADFCFPDVNTSCRRPSHPYAAAVASYVLLSAVSIITVTLNLLVIISISHFKQLHTPTNLLLLSLAVSDLLVGVLLMPVEIIHIEHCWFLGDLVCSLYYLVDYVITSASVANMVIISIDRYIAVCDPLNYNKTVTKKTAQLFICLCWLCSVIYRILLLNDHLRMPGSSNHCMGECVVVISYIAGIIDLICTFILPITIIIVLYLRVFAVALSQARAMRSCVTAGVGQQTGILKMKELKAARALGLVVIVFLICFCPYYFPTLTGEDTSVDAADAAFEIWLAHFNSCLNPVIYAFFYPWFRRAVKMIFNLQVLQPGSCNSQIL
ncbi:trace amine-associated receptor 1-like [Synchiropus splendidus]|uniref:trace amine-associated receptor 1-like n=1 Tax=Synchiropus splendidus TaxID=270530 RepID=UPI00237DEE37|nr:trace amine-associated receptor 1-like [Synchiropus splendidus]